MKQWAQTAMWRDFAFQVFAELRSSTASHTSDPKWQFRLRTAGWPRMSTIEQIELVQFLQYINETERPLGSGGEGWLAGLKIKVLQEPLPRNA